MKYTIVIKFTLPKKDIFMERLLKKIKQLIYEAYPVTMEQEHTVSVAMHTEEEE